MKKSTKIRIAMIVVYLIPVIIGAIYCAPLIVSRWDKCLSFVGIILAFIVIMVFKDAMKRVVTKPTLFVTSIIMVIISAVACSLGEQLLIMSSCALLGGVISLPLAIWYNQEVRPPTNKEVMEQFEKLKGSNNENSNQES